MRPDNSNDNDGDDEANNNKERLRRERRLKPIAPGKTGKYSVRYAAHRGEI